jgi:hypothetical protein
VKSAYITLLIIGLCRFACLHTITFGRCQTSLDASNPKASNKSCGTYLWFLFFCTQLLSAVELSYCSGERPRDFTTDSNELMDGAEEEGSGLPQFGFPRRLAMLSLLSTQ